MRFLSSILPALLLFTPLAEAATGDIVLPHVDLYKEVLEDSMERILIEEQEWTLEQKNELMPLPPEDVRDVQDGLEPDLYISATVDDAEVVFRDVPRISWFAPYVLEAIRQGIVSGYRDTAGVPTGLFGPADAVTIEQLARVAVNLAGIEPQACRGALQNASAKGRWSEGVVVCAEQRGWVLYSDGSIDVTRIATRAEVVVTLLQALEIEPESAKGGVFTDVQSSTQFSAFIERAAADSIVSGYTDAQGKLTGIFGPTDPVNRAAFAKIIVNALQKYGI